MRSRSSSCRASSRESSSPITQQRYTLSSGAPATASSSRPTSSARRPGPKTEIEGLYLTGASTKWAHGIYGSMTGGVGTADAVLGRALLREVRSGRVFGDPDRLPIHDADWDPLLACRRLAHKPRSHKRDYALERA